MSSAAAQPSSPASRLRPQDSLAGQVQRLSRWVFALVVAVVVTGLSGVATAEALRQDLAARHRPAVTANERLIRDLLTSQSALRGYLATGQPAFLAEDLAGARRIGSDRGQLGALLAGSRSDALLRQEAAIDRWLAFRARLVEARRTDPTAGAALAHSPFPAVASANAALGEQLAADVERNSRRVSLTLWGTGALLSVEGAGLAGLVILLRRRLLHRVLLPLEQLQQVVAGNASGSRAELSGAPQEIRELGCVVNSYLDQAERSDLEHRAAVERLESLDRQKNDFMATVSHELRTPLTSIAGYLEMLLDGDYGEPSAPQSQALGIVSRNTARLRAMIEQLLVLSRIEAQEVTLHVAPVRLAELATTVVENLRPQAESGRVALVLDAPQDLPPVPGDAAQLERALTNVVGNAVKFTPAGGTVDVVLRPDGDQQQVQVRDTGIGIPQADLVDVGRRFFRASNVTDQTIPGTGLGLAIVDAILASHGGRLELASRVGEGTTVTLHLPSSPAV